ncbi:hypothetical protein V1264_006043 [Littorina saxatilis]|uniref:Uncharacterized protein n=1 Tax=Littorina saxatilis TaxID=31220 RepID=A0AAN9G421_9CAEN
MIRLAASRGSGGGDPDTERERIESEKQQARIMTQQNVVLFQVFAMTSVGLFEQDFKALVLDDSRLLLAHTQRRD